MRWAVIGASTIAAEHMLTALRSVAGGRVDWLCSGSEQHGAVFAAAHGIGQFSTSLEVVLADAAVEAVYISSTNEKHMDQAMAAIAAGKHVLCEKPLAMTVAQAQAMVAAADAAGVTFGTNHHLRCAGSHRAMRDLIATGRVGRVLSLRIHHAVHLPAHLQGWRINDAGAGGGVILDIAVHDADCAAFLLGEGPVSVVAQAGVSGMGAGVEDSVMWVGAMPSGAMVMAHESFTHPFAGSGIEIHGTEGSVFARGVMTQRPAGEVVLVTAAGREVVSYATHNLYGESVRSFVAGVPAATGADGVASLRVALAVQAAAVTGMRVTV